MNLMLWNEFGDFEDFDDFGTNIFFNLEVH